MEPRITDSEYGTKLKDKFRQRYQDIISTPLTVEGIDNYAENALGKLIDLVQDVLAKSGEYGPWQNSKQQEEQALLAFGLPDVGAALDHICELEQDVSSLDSLISAARQNPTVEVFVPPDVISPGIVAGVGTFEKPEEIPRTKTILFILERDFGVDVHHPEKLELTSGALMSNTMRSISYDRIVIPELGRIILSCDEEGNRTFVFDTAKLAEAGIQPEWVIGFKSKKEIDEILHENPSVGQGVIYHPKSFIARMRAAIRHPEKIAKDDDENDPADLNYLAPIERAPEGISSVNGLAKTLGINRRTLAKVIEEHRDELGEIEKYRFGEARVAEGLTEDQIEIILPYLNLDIEKAPEGVLSIRGWSLKLKINYKTLVDVIEEHRDELGEIKKYKFGRGARIAEGFTNEQIGIIIPYLNLDIEKAPEEILSTSGWARKLAVAKQTLAGVIEEHHDELGKIKKYKFGKSAAIAEGFTEEQIKIIIPYLLKLQIGKTAVAAIDNFMEKAA